MNLNRGLRGEAQIMSRLSPRLSCDSSRTGAAWVCRTKLSFPRYFCNLCDKDHKLRLDARPLANSPSAFHDRKAMASISLNCDRHHNFAACLSSRTGLRVYPRGILRSPSAQRGRIPRLFFRPGSPTCGTPHKLPSHELPPAETKSSSDRSSANQSMTLRSGRPRNRPRCRRGASAPCDHGIRRGEDPGGSRCRSGPQIGKALLSWRTRPWPPYGIPSR